MNRSLPMHMRLISILMVIALAGLTRSGLAQDKTLRVVPISDRPSFTKRALVIGVGEYEHANVLSPVTQNDAKAFAELLQKKFGFPPEAITLLTDAPGVPDRQRPTYTHLIAAVDTLLNGVNKSSEVVFFFSGHGTRSGDHDWLVPNDGLASNVTTTCINYDDFKSRLDTLGPNRALLIVDACRNLLGGKGAGASGFGATQAVIGAQIAELLSCQPKEISQVGKPEDFQESVFTHFLLKGLEGDPEAVTDKGLVTFDSLKLFVQGKVSQYVSSRYNEPQNPDGRSTLGAMVLAKGPAVLKPTGGTVKIDTAEAQLSLVTDPPGAKIFIDGKDTGQVTPAELAYNFDGANKDFQLRLELPNYRVITGKVTLEIGKRTKVDQKLKEIVAQGPGQIAAGKTKTNAKDGAEMIFIPAGDFLMGDDDQSGNRRHKVMLSGYWMYKNLVTVGMYKKFCADTGRKIPPAPDFNPNWAKEDHPIVNVSWDDATAYCVWAGVNLPSEAQWEKAARGTQGLKYPWGNDYDVSKVWASKRANGDSGGTTAVGKYGVSPYGCTDMAGNVWQWCRDWLDDRFWSSRQAEGIDPENQSVGEKQYRCLRGGSWYYSSPGDFRATSRDGDGHDAYHDYDGFRCASGP